ncbi:unnamed protein product [Cyclocybe aegerita]|uniref:alpha-1,2-Mannosidase n=1 Tax=Cyclocybe aegerita TaxID=1973307 RepID=A0A8S0VRI6_CYCAE|nr:unnamed protein product [Cyclocybe aegerita]
MLPTHRVPPSPGRSRFDFTKASNGKFVTRWALLGVTVVALLWFGGPLISDMVYGPPEFDYIPPPPRPPGGPHVRPPPPPSRPPPEQALWDGRADEVREAFRHAWTGYKEKAFPHDELASVSGGSTDKYNGWSVTLFDSLDTMWIMGMQEEFADAVKSIKGRHFNATKADHYAGFFETTIRYLGGILSAYALSSDPELKRLADELGQILLPAFDGTESGLPAYSVNVETGEVKLDGGKNTVLFAEATSCQLEFKYLAKITGKKEYYQKVQKAMNYFYKADVKDGLFNDNWFIKDGTPTGSHFTIGATADSGYEYLLKQWLLSGDTKARDQYIKSATGIINKLLYLTPNRELMYVGDLVSGSLVHRLEHLSCFLGGVLGLGAVGLSSDPANPYLSPQDKKLHEWAGHSLAYTCAVSYADQVTGVGPDQLMMSPTGKKWIDEVRKWEADGEQGTPPGMSDAKPEQDPSKRDYYTSWGNAYLLRPETVESIFIMWRTTGDVKWRERGYAIFQGINKHARTEFGFSTFNGVDGNVHLLDDMPSWFLAETLKYLYLLFTDTETIPLEDWVFNTEAHPLPVFTWTEEERQVFGIQE